MIIYFYVSILIVASIITGIIVTIIEKRGLHPKQVSAPVVEKIESKVDVVQEEEPFVLEDNPVLSLDGIYVDSKHKPIKEEDLLLMKTIDLRSVADHIQKIEVFDEDVKKVDHNMDLFDEEII